MPLTNAAGCIIIFKTLKGTVKAALQRGRLRNVSFGLKASVGFEPALVGFSSGGGFGINQRRFPRYGLE
jgi:hypothetical protein